MKKDLSHDVESGSDIMPCIKIDKPLVVMLGNDVRNNVVCIWQNLTVFTQKHDHKEVLGSYDK